MENSILFRKYACFIVYTLQIKLVSQIDINFLVSVCSIECRVSYRFFSFLMQTNYGDIEFGFFPTVAPKTVNHIFKLVRLGGYNTNHFFRVLFSGYKASVQLEFL